MRRIATAHLLHGFIGAGKTTFARRLEHRHDAVRFTPDDWTAALFGSDPPAADFLRREQAIKDQLRPMWARLLELGVDVVLDYGFWSHVEREETLRRVRHAGARPRLYRLQLDDEAALRRVAARNLAAPDALQITPATFAALRERFEPLQPGEAFEAAP